MQIKQFYKKYNLMPGLVTHQLRVGGIVRLMTDDQESILTALVHDMGNLAKFSNLDPYWNAEQKIFRSRYGSDAHEATIQILDEAGLTTLKSNILVEADFYQNVINVNDFTKVRLPAVLTLYADSRVAMDGVVSLEERIVDLETRYKDHRNDRVWAPKLESYVQTLAKVDVTKITEPDVAPLFDELLTYEIE